MKAITCYSDIPTKSNQKTNFHCTQSATALAVNQNSYLTANKKKIAPTADIISAIFIKITVFKVKITF